MQDSEFGPVDQRSYAVSKDSWRPIETIAAADSSFLVGDGVFETMRVANGAILRLELHRRRMRQGCAALALDEPDWSMLVALVRGLGKAMCRLTVSRGPLQGGFASAPLGEAQVVATVRPVRSEPHALNAATVDWPRRCANSLSARCKVTSYADNLAVRLRARQQGADIGLMLDASGDPVCFDCANLLVFRNGHWLTPSPARGALPGTVIASLEDHLGVIERCPINRELLSQAQAVFATNAGFGVVPITQLDGRSLDSINDVAGRANAWLGIAHPS